MLAHLVGDIHQPLHVAAAYLDQTGTLVDPDVTHTIDPATETIGGNAIFDHNANFHGAWDALPTNMTVAQALDLLPAAGAVTPVPGPVEEWAMAWATDTILTAPKVFAGATYTKRTDFGWDIAFTDHAAYVATRDDVKRRQLAKAGARHAQLLNLIWP